MSDVLSKDIIEYLRGNPDFLSQHPEACELLHPPTDKDGNVVDFQSFMVKRLKDDKHTILQTTQEIVANSRSNMHNQARIHHAVLRILEAQSFDEFIMTLTMDISTILDVDIAALVLETDGQDIPHIHNTGMRIVPEGTVQKWMGGKDVLLESNIQGIEDIYGGGATLVASQALLRVDISMGTPPAILAFGSRDAGLFQDGQATDQVLFLARIVERVFRLWLCIPD